MQQRMEFESERTGIERRGGVKEGTGRGGGGGREIEGGEKRMDRPKLRQTKEIMLVTCSCPVCWSSLSVDELSALS